MKNLTRYRITLLISLVFLTNLDAQEMAIERSPVLNETIRINTEGSITVSDTQLIEMALARSRRLHNLNTNVEMRNYRLKSSGKLPNPELRLRDLSTRYFDKEYKEMQTGLRFNMPGFGEMGEEKQQARVRLSERKVDESRYYQKLIARIYSDIANVIMHDQIVKLAEKRLELESRRIRIIEEMVQLGGRSVVYFIKAKMWHAESKKDIMRAAQKQLLARRKLAKETGIDINTNIIADDLPEIDNDFECLTEIANQNRPEINLVDERIKLAYKQHRMEMMKTLPALDFFEINYHFEKEGRTDWTEFMMSINIPLFDWNYGNRKATELAVTKKEDEFYAIRESIEEEVSIVFIVYQDLLLDWKNFERDAETLIFEAEEVIHQAHKHKTLLPDEVIEMELTIIEIESILAEKKRDLVHAHIELLYAMGIVDSPEKLEK